MIRTLELASLDLREPITTAHGTLTVREVAVVTVDDGRHSGRGEAATLPGFGLEPHAAVVTALQRWCDDATAPDPTATPAAAGAVATATAARAAAAAGVSLATHLRGSPAAAEVATQAVVGDGAPGDTARACAQAVAAGFTTLKVKVGAGPPARDVERIRAAREAVGEGVIIRVDANGGWDRAGADLALAGLRELGVDLVEEPTPDLADFAELQRAHGVTVAIDEHAADRDAIDAAVVSGLGAVVLKPAVVGGAPAAHRLAVQLLAADLRVIVSSFMDGPVGLAAAVQVAAALERDETHGVGTATIFREPFPEHLVPRGGTVRVEP